MNKVNNHLKNIDLRKSLKNIIYDGLMTQTMLVLTGGIFLVDFALKMGASNYLIGLLAAIAPLAQLSQILGVYLVEKYRERKRITITSALISRFFLLFIVGIPFLIPPDKRVFVLFLTLLINASFASIGGCSWNSWMHSLIPHRLLGSYFSRRMFLATFIGVVLSVCAGLFIDQWKKLGFPILQGYSLMFFIGFLFGLIGLFFLSRASDVKMSPPVGKINLIELLINPFRDKNFRQLLRFQGSFTFAIQLAIPFFSVYMLKQLELPLALIIVLSVVNQLVTLVFLRVWGKFSDVFSNKAVLGMAAPLFLISVLLWTFTTLPDKYIFTVPLLFVIHILSGLSLSGVTLASNNIALKLSPKDKATSYLASVNVVNSLMAGSAPVFGGLLADFFSQRELAFTFNWSSPVTDISFYTINLRHFDFLFLISFILGLYALHRLAAVVEQGRITEKLNIFMVLSEAKRQARVSSPLGGIRYMLQFPYALMTNITVKSSSLIKGLESKRKNKL